MNWNDLRLRLRGLLFRSQVEADLDDELAFHLEMEARKLRDAGEDAAHAARAARFRFGRTEQVKEGCRDARGTRPLEDFAKDLAYGVRVLRKDRGYTLAAMAALAVGIAANTALFQIFADVVLRPLPVPEPNRLVSLTRPHTESPIGLFSFPDYLYLRDHATSFSMMAAETPSHLSLLRAPGTAPEPVMGLFVTANYLSTFGVHRIAGRDFTPEDEARTTPPYPVMLSENFWRRRMGADNQILGRRLTMRGMQVTVIGITPRDFMGTRPDVPDAWVIEAAQGDPQARARDRANLSSALTAQLRPGVTLAQAQAEVSALAADMRRDYPEAERQWNVRVLPAARFGPAGANFVTMYAILQAAMAMVLLIACSNVAGLLLGRAAARQREIAVRLSLGATRGRLVRQLVTEGVLVAVLAGAAAFLITWQGLEMLARYAATIIPEEGGSLAFDTTPDPIVFGYILGLSILAGFTFALAPALQSTRPDLITALKEETAGFGVRRKSLLRGIMIAGQVAVCLALLIGAGLLTSTSVRMLTLDPGFDTHRVLAVSIASVQELGYSPARAHEIDRRLEERIRALPGVASFSTASRVPLGGGATATRVGESGERYPYSYISRDYFDTLGIPLLRGRNFTSQEFATTNSPVTVISESLARRLWPAGDAISKYIALGSRTEGHYFGQRGPVSPPPRLSASCAMSTVPISAGPIRARCTCRNPPTQGWATVWYGSRVIPGLSPR
jgi:macrolide transport system ATP-binding/permease protein